MPVPCEIIYRLTYLSAAYLLGYFLYTHLGPAWKCDLQKVVIFILKASVHKLLKQEQKPAVG